MPVNTPSKSYADKSKIWQRCRDVFGGTDAVKARRTEYLPALEGQMVPLIKSQLVLTPYDAYLQRALFYPAGQRTVFGLSGIVFGHPISVEKVPKSFVQEFEDVTQSGTSLSNFALQMCQELLVVGRVGALADIPDNGTRPYWTMYKTEQITQIRSERVNGVEQITFVILCEEVETEKDSDEFSTECVSQYRVLRLRNVNGVRQYSVETYRAKADRKDEWVVYEPEYTPLLRGATLDFIPFVVANPVDLSTDIINPILLDLFDVNLSHFRTSADLEHGAHFTALPTPYVCGWKAGADRLLTIGAGNAWLFPSSDTQVGMLEFTGAGLQSLAELKEDKRKMMVTLGARMLETQKQAQEAEGTVFLRHAGESSTMTVLATTLSMALTRMVRFHLFWDGLSLESTSTVKVTLNPDFMDTLTADDAMKLMAMWQGGLISKKTAYSNLEWGKWTRPGVTFDQEEKDIAEEMPDEPPDLTGEDLNPDPNAKPDTTKKPEEVMQ